MRHRQTKGAPTDMFYLKPPRHISTLPKATFEEGAVLAQSGRRVMGGYGMKMRNERLQRR